MDNQTSLHFSSDVSVMEHTKYNVLVDNIKVIRSIMYRDLTGGRGWILKKETWWVGVGVGWILKRCHKV